VLSAPESSIPTNWRVNGSYFEACNCDAICPCRQVGGRAGGLSTYGECFGALSWQILEGFADDIDLSGLRTVMAMRYFDNVRPSTPWDVVIYVDDRADVAQSDALANIFLGRAGGSVLSLYALSIGENRLVRKARIELEHVAPRKRIGVIGYLNVEAEGAASDFGDVQCGIPGYDHPGTEFHGDLLRSSDPILRWEVRGRRNAAFSTNFDYRSSN
jgi:hypothetical protein